MTEDLLLVFAIILTMVQYAVFPLIFAKLRKKILTSKKYKAICFSVNFLIWILDMWIAFMYDETITPSGLPFVFWTWVFSALGTKILKRRGVLKGSQIINCANPSTSNEMIEVSDSKTTRKAESLNPKVVAASEEKPQIRFCRKCGFLLIPDSEFCSKCGTAVIKE